MHVFTVHAVSVMGGVCPIAQYAIPLVLPSRHTPAWSLCRSTFVSVVLFHEGNVDQNSHIWLCAYILHVLAVTRG